MNRELEQSEEVSPKSRKGAKAAGDRFEKRIQDYLESLGWKSERARAKIVWIPGEGELRRPISIAHDFFGCLDFIAFHPERPFTLCIQATLSHDQPRKLQELAAGPWNLIAQRIQLWERFEGISAAIRVRRLYSNEKSQDKEWKEFIFRMKDGIAPPKEVLD